MNAPLSDFSAKISSAFNAVRGATVYDRAETYKKLVPDFVPESYKETLAKHGDTYNIDPSIVAKMVNNVENKPWDPKAQNPNGSAVGLTQLTKAARADILSDWTKTHKDAFDPTNPAHSIEGAYMYLGQIRGKHGFKGDDLIRAYHVGAANLKWAKTGPDTPDKRAVREQADNYLSKVNGKM